MFHVSSHLHLYDNEIFDLKMYQNQTLSTSFFFSWKQFCKSNFYVKKIVLCKIQNVEMRNRNTTRKECWFALHNFTLCTNRWGESVPTMWCWQWDEIEVIPPARCALSRVWPKKKMSFRPKGMYKNSRVENDRYFFWNSRYSLSKIKQ